ncbi:MAG: methyltransferase domain-containing protein [Geobacteraceae bacterium]|nr:methyltransferase domain-containing protein [Geobacteraceae bacterium]
MNIERLVKYVNIPQLYESETDAMWTDPYISKQLLQFHIDPDNDMASRGKAKIDLIVNWMLSEVCKGKLEILDLGCGPGLYAEALAKKGHHVTGIDFSKTSIDYAKESSNRNGLKNDYICMNYLDFNENNKYDLAALIYLDFCVLKPGEREKVLLNVYKALKPNGTFIFDTVNSENIEEKTLKESWEVCQKGFWSDRPYLVLNRGAHYQEAKVLLNQHIVIDEDENIRNYLFWSTYYEYEDIEPILRQTGFRNIQKHENVLPQSDMWNGENVDFYVVRKLSGNG